MTLNSYLPYLLLTTLLLLPFNTQLFFFAIPKALGIPGTLVSSWKEVMFALMATMLMAEFLLGSRVPLARRVFRLSLVHVSGFFLPSISSPFSFYPKTRPSLFSGSDILWSP